MFAVVAEVIQNDPETWSEVMLGYMHEILANDLNSSSSLILGTPASSIFKPSSSQRRGAVQSNLPYWPRGTRPRLPQSMSKLGALTASNPHLALPRIDASWCIPVSTMTPHRWHRRLTPRLTSIKSSFPSLEKMSSRILSYVQRSNLLINCGLKERTQIRPPLICDARCVSEMY